MEAAKRKKSDVTRIFWPWHCTAFDSGLLVGWNVHSFTACVATVVCCARFILVAKSIAMLTNCLPFPTELANAVAVINARCDQHAPISHLSYLPPSPILRCNASVHRPRASRLSC